MCSEIPKNFRIINGPDLKSLMAHFSRKNAEKPITLLLASVDEGKRYSAEILIKAMSRAEDGGHETFDILGTVRFADTEAYRHFSGDYGMGRGTLNLTE